MTVLTFDILHWNLMCWHPRRRLPAPAHPVYAVVPCKLRRVGVAMVPFAPYEALRVISPKETLWGKAGGTAIVGAAVRDD